MRVSYVIVFVSDMKRSVAYYRDIIGLALKYETPSWTEFATEGATLALHNSDAAVGDEPDPALHPPGRCRPGFSTTDLTSFHERMLEHGVPCVQEPKPVFGVRIAQYVDPDGLVLSVSESK